MGNFTANLVELELPLLFEYISAALKAKFYSIELIRRITTPERWQSKTLILKKLETEFLIAICRQTGDKWQSKTLFLAIFDPRSSIVKSVLDCRLSGVITTDSHARIPKFSSRRSRIWGS